MALTDEIKRATLRALIENRGKYPGTDAAFATKWGINASVWSTLKNSVNKTAPPQGLLKEADWVRIAIALEVETGGRRWNTVTNTPVYQAVKNDLEFCQKHSKSMIFVDECEIGKTWAAKHLAVNGTNIFYVDCSLCKGKRDFIRTLAIAVGVEAKGTLQQITRAIIFMLNSSEKPLVIIDEAGDLEYLAWLEIKAFWNATDGRCGWYMIGADGLAAKIEAGIEHRKVGYREIFSRFGSKITSVLPTDKQQNLSFKTDLLTKVIEANKGDNTDVRNIVKKCLSSNASGHTGLLRRAESLLMLNDEG